MKTVTIGFLPFADCPDTLSNAPQPIQGSRFKLRFVPVHPEPEAMTGCDIWLLRPTLSDWRWLDTLLQICRSEKHRPVILLGEKGAHPQGFSFLKQDPNIFILDDVLLLETLLPSVLDVGRSPEKWILFVDDDPDVLAAYERTFRKSPWRIRTASSAQQAMERLGEGPVDLVVTDIKMPGMHGFELIAQIRKNHQDLPVIVCSGYHGMREDAGLYFYKVAAFIEKPASMELLTQKIQAVLGPREGA